MNASSTLLDAWKDVGGRRESISYVLREGWFTQAVSPGNVSLPVGLQTAEVQGHVTTGQGSEFG